MIEKIKQRFGSSVKILKVQEYYANCWVKYNSALSIQEQIDECISDGAVIISFHITVESIDEETKDTIVNDIYPDIKI